MKEKIYKYSLITFVIINIITLYLFYDYFTEKQSIFHGIGIFFNFIRLIIFSLGLSLILLLVRFYFFIKEKKNYLKTNFFYVFSAIFSFNVFLNWVICICLDLFPLKTELTLIVLGLFSVSIFMLYDIYKYNFSEKILN